MLIKLISHIYFIIPAIFILFFRWCVIAPHMSCWW